LSVTDKRRYPNSPLFSPDLLSCFFVLFHNLEMSLCIMLSLVIHKHVCFRLYTFVIFPYYELLTDYCIEVLKNSVGEKLHGNNYMPSTSIYWINYVDIQKIIFYQADWKFLFFLVEKNFSAKLRKNAYLQFAIHFCKKEPSPCVKSIYCIMMYIGHSLKRDTECHWRS